MSEPICGKPRYTNSKGALVATLGETERKDFTQHIASLNHEHGWVRWDITGIEE